MEIKYLSANNLKEVSCKINNNLSYGIAGLSGSGKSTFCTEIADESLRRIVTLLPKSEYRFLFSDKLKSNFSAQDIKDLPLVFYLGKLGFASNPRSTVGTHTGVFKEIRKCFASKFQKTSDFFSFNSSIMWCAKCKGRGSTSGKICDECGGGRYSNEINNYLINIKKNNYTISQINQMTVADIIDNSKYFALSNSKLQVLKNINQLNIGYLSLDRVMSTLSGGETVRVLLAEFMAECQNSLIIIDELSIGLDHNTLVGVLKTVAKIGDNNQIWLIDHSDTVLDVTGGKLFFGPGSGKNGGQIVKASPRPNANYCNINSSTTKEYYVFKNLFKRNIAISKLEIPKNRIISITGESGCGKSTLINDCIVPAIAKDYKKVVCDVIGQDRNQSITSKSTIATFLDIKKRLEKYDEKILSYDISELLDIVKKDKNIYFKLSMLVDLGLGYLSLERKVQSLSTGEFQCLHLISRLTSNMNTEMILIFDEPSKGLSQNILNLLMAMLRKIVMNDKKTILIIEHNSYILKCSDYIIDFGKRKTDKVESLKIITNDEWVENYKKNIVNFSGKLNSKISDEIYGIKIIDDDIENVYSYYDNMFKGGLLKNFSQTAQWIYSDYETEKIVPVITLDLEENLYSKNTFLFEVAGVINSIVKKSKTKETKLFDFFSKDNLCECCKGTTKISTIDFEKIIKDSSKGLWDGLLQDDVMTALKKYNYSKIKFLLKEVKKVTGTDLTKPYNQMSEYEKNTFLYGYWKESFYDTAKKTQRKWQGIIHLVVKYMRSSTSEYRKIINESKSIITCPICKGAILNHEYTLKIGNKDIRDIVSETIEANIEMLQDIPQIKEIIDICGCDIKLNSDISQLSQEIQVCLKMLDVKYASLYRYLIVLKNCEPFNLLINNTLEIISQNNKVIKMDYNGIKNTKKELLDIYFSKGKIKLSSYVYEALGYKRINTEINKIRKSYPCQYCRGSKVLREESIFDGVDVTETPCLSCGQTGISNEGLNKKVEKIHVKSWLLGTLKEFNFNIPDSLSDVPLTVRISELNKKQIVELASFIKE